MLTLSSCRNYLILGCSLAAAGAVAYGSYVFLVSPLRRALPSGASEVHEGHGDHFPDWDYKLEARLEPTLCSAFLTKEFAEYDGSITSVPVQERALVSWGSVWKDEATWWDPSPDLNGTVFRIAGRVIEMAKCERGYLYVLEYKY
jgi:hypothetical protein